MKILVYDTECSGLDVNLDFVQELGWAVYDLSSWRLLFAKSKILKWPTAYDVHPEALAVTGLSKEFCDQFGERPSEVFAEFLNDVEHVDYLCGHNAIAYDQPIVAANVRKSLFPCTHESRFLKLPHIDTLVDCPFPSNMKVHALKYLAYDHGYILSDAHQALADVFACKHILQQYDFNLVEAVAATPLITLTAKVDFNDLDARAAIKQARFYWNVKRKLWEKRIREYYVPGIQLTLSESVLLNIDPPVTHQSLGDSQAVKEWHVPSDPSVQVP